MVCIDTNVIIYLAKGLISPEDLGLEPLAYSTICKIEALGYNEMRSSEEARIRELFAAMIEIKLSNEIAECAIRLRQDKKISLGDSIVAASAMVSGCGLYTANVDDFKHIDGLELINPLVLE